MGRLRIKIPEKSAKILLLTIGLCCTISLQSQSKFTDNMKLMINYHSGYNIPEYQFLSYITQDYIQSIDISLIKETTGNTKWEQLYKYPEHGFSFFYSTLGNDEILGREYALTYFFRIDLFSRKRFHFFNRTGIGFSYVTQKFDTKDNFLNVAVGSNVNIHFNTRVGARYELSEKMEFNTGISFDHFSNANTSEPNLGINYLTGYGGLSYSISPKTERKKVDFGDHEPKDRIDLFGSIGGKHTRALSANYFFTSSISLEMDRSYFRAFHLGIGADIFYDSSVETEMEDVGKNYKSGIYDFQTGVHISQSIVYNKFSLILQEGVYLILQERLNNNIMYNRGIVKYQIRDNIAVRFAMKSHLNILDYPELGIGVKL